MANTVTTQVLENTPRRYIVKFYEAYVDTAGTSTTIVDASTITGPDGVNPVDYFQLTKIIYSLAPGARMQVLFDADTDDIAWTGHEDSGEVDFTTRGAGVVDPKSTGYTGDIKIATAGLGSGDVVSVVLELKKKQN